MDKKLNIEERALYVGANDDYCNEFCNELLKLGNIHFKRVISVEEVIRGCYEYVPALVVFKLSMNMVSTLVALGKFKRLSRSLFVVLIPYDSRAIRRITDESKVDFAMPIGESPKSDAIKVWHEFRSTMRFGMNLKKALDRPLIITEEHWNDPINDDRYSYSDISDMLTKLGIPEGLSGHSYLITAVAIQSYLDSIPNPKFLYERIAEYYDTTPRAVEKAIRYAIERAWTVGDIGNQTAMFGLSVDPSRGKPTNAEFIARLAIEVNLGGLPLGM